jgi:hypothetical protein
MNSRITVTSCKQMIRVSAFLVISTFIASLAACNSSPESTSVNPSPATSPDVSGSPATQTNSSDSTSKVSIPSIQSFAKIVFKEPTKDSNSGYFEAINDSSKLSHEISKTASFKVSGWAVSPDYSKPADLVIITAGNDNTPIAVAPVTIDRQDIVKGFKKPALAKSGWSVQIDPASLPNDKVILKAWAYNPTTKEATPLVVEHEIIWK